MQGFGWGFYPGYRADKERELERLRVELEESRRERERVERQLAARKRFHAAITSLYRHRIEQLKQKVEELEESVGPERAMNRRYAETTRNLRAEICRLSRTLVQVHALVEESI